MGWRGFMKFCNQSKIKDDVLNSSVLSTYFAAAHYHQLDSEDNAVNVSNRYEFLEILIRLARGKFMDFGSMTCLADAMQQLIEKHVLPLESQCAFYQDWRHKELYTNSVNDILATNIKAIRKLYDKIASVQNAQRLNNMIDDYQGQCPTIDQIQCLLHRKMKNVDRHKIIQAFYSSKMLVQEESTAAGLLEYSILHWCEFLEFIGRLAQFKYRSEPNENSLSLTRKIHIVLDEILPLVGSTCIEVPTETIVISESDEDY